MTPDRLGRGPARPAASSWSWPRRWTKPRDTVGVDFIGGFSALVEKQASRIDEELMAALPRGAGGHERVCASVNVATTRAGHQHGRRAHDGRGDQGDRRAHGGPDGDRLRQARRLRQRRAGQPVHGRRVPRLRRGRRGDQRRHLRPGRGGRRARGVCRRTRRLQDIAEEIKRTVFKITRVGEHVGREVARRLGVPFGIVDLSLAPTPRRATAWRRSWR